MKFCITHLEYAYKGKELEIYFNITQGGGLFNSQQTPKEDKSVLDRNIYAYKRNNGSMTKGGSNTAKSKRKEMCGHKTRYK